MRGAPAVSDCLSSHRLLTAAAVIVVSLTAACAGRGCGSRSIAELVRTAGAVERDFAAAVDQWQAAGTGTTFDLGDGVRTTPRATARVRLTDGSELALASDTTIRFLAAPPGGSGRRVGLVIGAAEIEAGRSGFTIGNARIAAGTRARISSGNGEVRFAVRFGSALVETENGTISVAAGQTRSFRVTTGDALIEVSPEPVPAEPATPATAVLQTGGAVEVGGRGPARADFVPMTGSSFTVHSPSVPIAVGLSFEGRCAGGGVVELLRRSSIVASSRGDGGANISVPAGSFRYRVRCLTEAGLDSAVAFEGSVRVLRDAGLADPPPPPPLTRLETDGRRYRVIYQTRSPNIDVVWTDAPSASGYTLTLESDQRPAREIRTARASHRFREGELGEGTHRLTFGVAGQSAQRSRTTFLTLQYDNAEVRASIREPRERAFTPGSTVHVAGIALPGWSVSVGATELPLDRQMRFARDVTVPTAQGTLAIRLAHPTLGVHYYLRRPRGN